MSRINFSAFAGLATIAATLAGCGAAPGLTQSGTAVAAASAVRGGSHAAFGGPGGRGQGHPGMAGFGKGGPGMGPGSLYADLTLTDAQKLALQAIDAKYAPTARPKPTGAKPADALHAALFAVTVDDAALRAAIATQQADQAAYVRPSLTARLVEERGVLTDEQRAAIVTKLEAVPAPKAPPADAPKPPAGDAKPPSAADWTAKLDASLLLTTEQKAAYDALLAAEKANRPTQKPADGRAAMITFWKTGDTAGLAALAPTAPVFPTEAFVKAAETLDLAQRKALLGGGGFGGPGRDGFGGPGKGGFDGPGKGGHGEGGFGGRVGGAHKAPPAPPTAPPTAPAV